MSRSGYYDDCEDPLAAGRWKAQVKSATNGKRGQKLLRDMLAALDAMPEKRLITGELVVSDAQRARNAEFWAKIVNRSPSEYDDVIKRPVEHRDGDVCALGALGRVRGLDMSDLDPEEPDNVAAAFDIASPLAREIVYMNDEYTPWRMVRGWHGQEYSCDKESPEDRWGRMRKWIEGQIKKVE